MKKINKLIAILLVAVCVLSGCAGSNTGKQEETVTMRANVTSFEKAGFLVTPGKKIGRASCRERV